jgi:hypothetical protein
LLTSNRDIIIAISLLLVGVLASAILFFRLFGTTSSDQEVLEYLAEDVSQYVLKQDGRCVGSFDVSIEDAKLLIVRGKGSVKLPRQGEFVTLDLQGFFNPLGQLFRFKGALELPATSISLSGQGVHPIESTVNLKIKELELDKDISLPGPLMLEYEEGSKRYALRYSRLSSKSSKPYEAVLNGVLGRLKITLSREASGCANIEALDVDKIFAEVQKMRSTFQGMLGNERMQQLLLESGA